MGTISLSMIVKNESSCLETALNSVKGVDEIIICDTGSTDNTVEIARRYTDKVYTDYKWNDNFAEARNHAADKCTMDYILILDADEVLQEGAVEAFKEFDGEALGVNTKCASTGIIHQSIRLHRNTKEIRWQGAIHNYLNVEPSHITGHTVTYHYSKSHEYDPDRTLRILKKQVKAKSDNGREMYYLAKEYINKKDLKKAEYWYKRYIKKSDFPAEKADALVMLSKLYFQQGRNEDARRCCLEAIYINPDYTEALSLMAKITKPIHRLKWQRIADNSEGSNVLFHVKDKRLVVTMLCEEDFAGSGYRIMQAIRAANPLIDIEQIVLNYCALGHPSGPAAIDIGDKTVQHRINISDIIHFKGDFAYNGSFDKYKLPDTAKRIYTVGGSFFRRHGNKLVSHATHELDEYKADFKSALTPDLIYADDWHYTPHTWNRFEYTFTQGDYFNVLHLPSDPTKKGTDIVNKAMELLMSKRSDIKYICTNGLTPDECLDLKKLAHLYIDQLVADVYGNATIEALGFGVPVVSWLGDYYGEIPVQSPKQNTPESLAELIDGLLNWDTLQKLSVESFEYAKRIHGSVGAFWVNKYEELWQAKDL